MRKILQIIILGAFIGLFWFHYQGNSTLPSVDPELKSYVQEWESDMKNAGIDYNLCLLDHIKYVDSIPNDIFGDGDPLRAGFSDQSTRSIYIRRTDDYRPIHVKVILYHELGHYMFQLDHTASGEIMGSALVEDSFYYKDNWSILISSYINHIKDEE